MGQSNNQLAHFRKAKRELALVTLIDEVKEIRDKAEALRVYAKQAGESLEMQNNCAEIKIRAERRAGELLKESGRKKGETNKKIMCHDGILSPTLKKLGIEPKQSMRWQIIANIPERIFEQHVQETMARAKTGDTGAELTTVGVLRLAKIQQRRHKQKKYGSKKYKATPLSAALRLQPHHERPMFLPRRAQAHGHMLGLGLLAGRVVAGQR